MVGRADLLHATPRSQEGRPLQVRLAAGDAGLAMLDESWNELVLRQPRPNPALSGLWLRELTKWESGVPLIVTVGTGGRLVAGGAFGIRAPAGRLGPRLATWLGDERQWFSPDLLVDPAHPDGVSSVIDALLGTVDLVDVSAAADGPMATAMRNRVAWMHSTPRTTGWTLPLPPPRLGHAKRRADYVQRRACRRGACVSVTTADTPARIERALERLFELHRERWSGRPGEIARFSTTDLHRAWYRRLVSLHAERGDVAVSEVAEDGRVVASALSFLCGRGSIFHTTAIAPTNHLLEGGHVALLACVEAAASAGAEVMDLGWGAGQPGSPKARLGPREVPIARLLAASSPHHQRLLEGLDAAAGAVRRARSRRPFSEPRWRLRAS